MQRGHPVLNGQVLTLPDFHVNGANRQNSSQSRSDRIDSDEVGNLPRH
jgi:hypothetical protein